MDSLHTLSAPALFAMCGVILMFVTQDNFITFYWWYNILLLDIPINLLENTDINVLQRRVLASLLYKWIRFSYIMIEIKSCLSLFFNFM